MKKIIFLLGTARSGNLSQIAADFVMSCARKRTDIEPNFVDVASFLTEKTIGPNKETPNQWQQLVASSDALVIISPEYNHGYPGELKMLLDSAYQEYAGKPAAICAVSNGPIGGARMAEQLKLVLSAFQMNIINAAVYFSNMRQDTKLDDSDFYQNRINGMIDEVVKYCK